MRCTCAAYGPATCATCADSHRLRRQVEEALSDIYNECGPDLGWVNRTPSRREFNEVLRDLLAQRNDEAYASWRGLSRFTQECVLRRVGP